MTAEPITADRIFRRLEPQNVTEFWPLIRPHIDTLLTVSDGEYSPRHVFDLVLSQKFHLWLAWAGQNIEGIALTYFIDYPLKRYMVINGAAGLGAKSWLEPAMVEMQEWAKAHKCQKMQVRGRKGWRKLLPNWAFKQEVLELVL